MKNWLLLLLLTVFAVELFGQLRPQYTQYLQNQYIINPAIAGIENYTDIKISHRQQWMGIADAPATTYFTIHGSIGDTRRATNPTSIVPEGENPRGSNYWDNYLSAEPHHGWGATIFNDKTGPISRLAAYGTYAYHVGLTETVSISGGINFGVIRNSVNMSKLNFDDPNDPVLNYASDYNKIRPDIGAGIWIYGSSFFTGFSVMQLLDQGLHANRTVDFSDSRTMPVFIGSAGIRFLAGEMFNVIPSIVVRHSKGLPLGIDINTKLLYLDRFWAGAAYRINNSISGMVGMQISPSFNVGYAYDYTTASFGQYAGSTHEIVVGFTIGNRFGDMCPTNVW